MRVPLPPPSPAGRTGSVPPAARAARVPTPSVREPPAAPVRGRSPGGALGSSIDQPMPSTAPKAGRPATPPPPAPKARARAGATRDPDSFIFAADCGSFFVGMGDTRGFAVAGESRAKALAVPPRSISATQRGPDTPPPGYDATAAGRRVRTRSARRPANTDGNWESLNACCEAIALQLELLRDTFPNFPGDRLRLWRDDHGNQFDPAEHMSSTYGLLDSWYRAVLRTRHLGEVAPISPPNVPFVTPAYTDPTGGSWFSKIRTTSFGSFVNGVNIVLTPAQACLTASTKMPCPAASDAGRCS